MRKDGILTPLSVASTERVKERDYWLEKLSGFPGKSRFPLDCNRKGAGRQRLESVSFELSSQLSSALIKLSTDSDVRLHMILAAGLKALLHRYLQAYAYENADTGADMNTCSTDIVVGAPILRPDAEDDFINTVLVLRTRVESSLTFKELLLAVKETVSAAMDNQNYPVEILAGKLNMTFSKEDEFPLFDIAILVENIHDKKYLSGVNLNMIVSFLRRGSHIRGRLEYNPLLYRKTSIQGILTQYKCLLQEVTTDVNRKLCDIELMSAEDKKQILSDFNDTAKDYPADKAIHRLFAEQAERTPDQTALTFEGEPMTYHQLNKEASALASYLRLIGVETEEPIASMVDNSHQVIVAILGILKAGGAYVPLNAEYPNERIKYILKDCNARRLLTNNAGPCDYVPDIMVINPEDNAVYQNQRTEGFAGKHCSDNLAYIMYTSGSTGTPKGVMVEHRSAVRLVRNTNYIEFKEGDSILLTGALEFDASTFEIWGALLNGLTLHLVHKDTKLNLDLLKQAITASGVTTMWMTSPFFNQMLDTDIEIFAGLKNLLVGGDALSPAHINRVRNRFPELTVINGYGPTENTTFSTTYQVDKEHQENIPIGKPISNSTAYILDRHYHLVPIGAAGELFVGGDGLSRGYLNNPELTAERFIDSPTHPLTHSTIYRTGDLARRLQDGNIEFLGRRDHQVKIRGFRIEPGEIENHLIRVEGIREAVVVDRKAKDGGKYLCAYVVPSKEKVDAPDTMELRKILSQQLPDYMVPACFVILEKIPLNSNGKVDIKALPEPGIGESGTIYDAPRDKLEKKLAEIWMEVLDLSVEPGINHDFFDLGGHSLKATTLVYQLYQEFSVNIKIEEVFTHPTIGELSQRIKESEELEYIEVFPVEEKEYYELSYAQRRLWVLCQFEKESTAYNMPSAIMISGLFKIDAFIEAVQTLTDRHESLRTVFISVDGEPRQKVVNNLTFNLEQIDIRLLNEETKETEARRLFTENANRAFDLEHGPLFRFTLVRLEDEKYLLIYNFHHINNDGWSRGNINNEIIMLYNAFSQKRENPLPLLKLQYKDYTRWHNHLIEIGSFNASRDYWLEKFKDKPNGIELPLDHPRKPVQTFNGGRVAFNIDKEKTSRLAQLSLDLDATLFMGLLTLLNIFLYRYTGQKDIIVGAPIANRKRPELHSMVGFMVNTLVYRSQVDPGESFIQLLEKIKQETLTCYRYQDYPFDLLVEQLEMDRDLSQSPLFNFMLAHNNAETEDVELTMEGITVSPYPHREDFNMSKFDLIFIMDEYEKGEVHTRIEYNSDLFDRSTIERMADNFLTLVDNVIAGIDTPIFELDIISDVEYKRVIHRFNDTSYRYTYPGLTLQELFENQVEQSGEKTAAVCNGEKISYRDLNRKINRLAHYLRNRYGIKPNDVIGVSVDRSIDMIVTLWGIIKSGGAYLAVDPTYPRERVLHILSNSQADLLIIDKMRPELFGGYQGEIIDIHLQKDKIARESPENPTAVNRFSDILYVNYTSGSTGIPNGAMLSHDCLTNLIQWQNEKTAIDGSLRCLQFTSINFCVSFQEIMGTLTAGGELYLIGDIERQDIDYLMDFLSQNQIELLFLPFSYLNFLFNESTRWNRSFNHNLKHIITAGEQLKITAGLKGFLDLNPGLKLHNHYGSTEMHVVTSYTLDASTAGQTPIPPAGKPIANVKIHILDEYFNPVPIGVWGELFVDGKSEILGYINNSALTDQKLVKHPLLSEDNKRLYRSGDTGRWREDGNIELRGRKDFQVKVRGFRVEPGEIESKLLSIERIKQCVVVVKEDDSRQKCLVAYVVVEGIDAAEIKRIIGSELPQYMIPDFVILDSLPLMPNGKVDRARLPAPDDFALDSCLEPIKAGAVSHLLKDENFGKYIEDVLTGKERISDETPLEKVVAFYAYLFRHSLPGSSLHLSGIDCDILSTGELFRFAGDEGADEKNAALEIPIQQLFEQQAKKTPGNTAVVEYTRPLERFALTYRELNKASNRLARLLRRKGVKPGTVVGILSSPSVEMVIAILAVLKAGGAYMIIPAHTPQKQVLSRLKENRATLLLARDQILDSYSYTALRDLASGNRQCCRTAPRPPLADLDSLPLPDRSLVDYEKYSRYIGITMVKDCVTILSSRGCPYNCAYCHKIWPRKQVRRSAENIFREVKLYYEMGVRRFAFIDDIFNLDTENSSRFFELVLDHGLDVQFYFSGGLRGDILTPGFIDLMVKAGTVNIAVALETASPRLQKLMGKNLDIGNVRKNLEYICKNYPHVILELHTMHGFPTETEIEAQMTLDFIKSLKWLDFPYIHMVRIYPNTEMERWALEQGISKEAILESEGMAYHEWSETCPFEKNFTRNYQAEFLNDYFLSKERLLQVLPRQMKVLTEADIVQKYHSYLPVDIKSLDDLLEFVGIRREELGVTDCLPDDAMRVPGFNRKIGQLFPAAAPGEQALRILLLDLSQYFSTEGMLFDVVEAPLGLISLLTYLNTHLGSKIHGKIAKARADFDNYSQLKVLIENFKPDLIGIRTLTFYKDFFHRTIAMIRHWGIDVPIIAGGPYATSDFHNILQDPNVDLVVYGEGEATFLELVEKISENEGKLPGEPILKEIPGLVFTPGEEAGARSGSPGRELLMLDRDMWLRKDAEESVENLESVNHVSEPAQILYPGDGSKNKDKEERNKSQLTHRDILHMVSRLESIRPSAASFLFDGSPHQVFAALRRGGALYLLPGESKAENIHLLEFYRSDEARISPGFPEHIHAHIHLLLKKEHLAASVAGKALTAPTNEVEAKLVEIWSELLGIEKERIGIEDNFFELGGHSLKATLLMSKIHKQLNVKIPLVELFMKPTIRGLSKYIKDLTEDKYVPIKPAEEKEYDALSSAQKRMYILMNMETDSIVYNMPLVLELEGEVDVKKLEEVFIKIIRRHESLRTSFTMINREPVQEILEDVEFEIEYYDLAAKTREDTRIKEENHHSSFIIHHFVRAFDLSKAPLLRVGLVKIDDETYILMVDMHHIISDGTSIGGLTKEFMALYAGEELPPLKIQYRDFSQWQNSEKIKKTVNEQEEYWLKEFAGEIPVLNLPTDYPRPLIQRFEGNSFRVEIGAEDTEALRALSLKEETTMFMLLLALYNVLLSRLSGQEEIIVGTPTAGRRHADLQQVIGMFVNTLALRNFPTGEKSFKRFLQDVKARTLEAFENQEYQFEDLVEKVSVNRDASRNPLFDTMFVLQNLERAEIEIPGLKLKPYELQSKISKFDITFQVYEVEQGLTIFIEYCTAIFEEETIRGFLDRFSSLIKDVCRNPEIQISELDILTVEEKHRLLYRFNDTAAAYPRDKTIHELFEEQAARSCDGTAVVCVERRAESVEQDVGAQGAVPLPMGHVSLTYKELNQKANRLAHLLRAKGVEPDTIVGIMVDRSIEMIVGILGILKAGGAYLPIDINYPTERIRYMLNDVRVEMLLTQYGLVKKYGADFQVIDLQDKNIYAGPARNLEPVNSPGDLLYVIYTSGSTGNPKGVTAKHQNAVRLVKNTNFYTFNQGQRFLQTGALEFDASTGEIWGALLNGLSLYLYDKNSIMNPHEFKQILKLNDITTIWLTSTLFNQMLDADIETFSGLRYLLVGGEALSPVHINRLRKRYPGIKVINGYGPTENVTFSTTFAIDKDYEVNIPIGSPIANSGVYIVDQYFNLVPVGVVGELVVAGDGVARGYLNNVELTAAKFVDSPFVPGEKVYKTGDLARRLPGGVIEFMGRIDTQVKIRGYRIELGEIESQLLKHAQIEEAVVVAKETGKISGTGNSEAGDMEICAYVVSPGDIIVSELKDYLKKFLPPYMVPVHFVQLDKIPLNSNGKVNRKLLPDPGLKAEGNYIAPGDEIEEKLVEIWSQVLGIEKENIGLDSDFFELGGHSLKLVIVTASLHKELGVRVPLEDIFTNPTVRELSRYIKGLAKNEYKCIELVEEKEYYPLSSAQQRMYIQQQIDKTLTNYNVTLFVVLEGELDRRRMEESFSKMIKRHESLRTGFEIINAEPVQKIHNHKDADFEIEYYDLTENGRASTAQIKRDFIRPFRLAQVPLLRVGLIKNAKNKHILMIDTHHIIMDGTSMGIFINDFMALYSGQDLPVLKLQYKDFAQWQKNQVRSGKMKAQEDYWVNEFEKQVPVLNLPTDYPRPAVRSFEGDRVTFVLDKEETGLLNRIAKEEGATLFMVLLTQFTILLQKLGGQEEITVGTGVAGRRHSDLARVIGMFVNMLALKNFPEGEKTFNQFLGEVKAKTLKAFDNQDYQFEVLVEKVGASNAVSRHALFDVILAFQNIELPEINIPGLTLKPCQYENNTSKFDLNLNAAEKDGRLILIVEYCTKLFKKETVERFVNYFKEIITAVAENRNVRLEDIRVSHQFSNQKINNPQIEFGFQEKMGETAYQQ